jgi:D-glycero-D-manno-heptose 1,7-bisphosphate phosphatase
MSLSKAKAIFLDRDGIINVDHGYVHEIEAFEFNEGIFEALLALQDRGFLLIVVTNQSGIARGYYTQEQYQVLTTYMVETFLERGIRISAVYHCPHGPDAGCKCRKPKAGMLKRAQKEFKIDMKRSWMVGDKESDMLAAKKAGIEQRILVSKEFHSKEATIVVEHIRKISSVIQ